MQKTRLRVQTYQTVNLKNENKNILMLDKKGINVFLAFVLVVTISIAGVVVVMRVWQPYFERSRDFATLTEARSVMNNINSLIKQVAYEGEGSSRKITFDSSGGEYRFYSSDDKIIYELESKYQLFPPGMCKREGDLEINTGADVRAYEADVTGDGQPELVIENSRILFAVNKTGNQTNPAGWDSSYLIKKLWIKDENKNITPSSSSLYIQGSEETKSGTGYVQLLDSGDCLSEGRIKFHLETSKGTIEIIYTLKAKADFIELNTTFPTGEQTSTIYNPIESSSDFQTYENTTVDSGSLKLYYDGVNYNSSGYTFSNPTSSFNITKATLWANDTNYTTKSFSDTFNDYSKLSEYKNITIENGNLKLNKSVISSNWWNTSFKKCQNITISSPISDYQYKLILNTTNFNYSYANDDGSDIRIVNASCGNGGVEVPYWIEEWNESGDSTLWFRGDNSSTTVYSVYYNYTNAKSKSNGTKTWNFFDDFVTDTTGEYTLRVDPYHSAWYLYTRPSWASASKKIRYEVSIYDLSCTSNYGSGIDIGTSADYDSYGDNTRNKIWGGTFTVDTDSSYCEFFKFLTDTNESSETGINEVNYTADSIIINSTAKRFLNGTLYNLSNYYSVLLNEEVSDVFNNYTLTDHAILLHAGWGMSKTFSWDSSREALHLRAKRNDHNYGHVDLYLNWYAEGRTHDPEPTTSIGSQENINDYLEYSSEGHAKSTQITPNQYFLKWKTFQVSDDTTPDGTNISYKILKASDDLTLCSISSSQAQSGYDISSCAGQNSIKLYANLSTTNTSNTPLLHEWNVSWLEQIGNITYELSADGGSHWESVSKGNEHTFTYPGDSLKVRINLSTTDTQYTPSVENYTINYTYTLGALTNQLNYTLSSNSNANDSENWVCTQDLENNNFIAWVFNGTTPSDTSYSEGGNNYGISITSPENILLAFSKGDCSKVKGRESAIKSGSFWNSIFPAFSYETLNYVVNLILEYTNINIVNDLRIGEGTYNLIIKNTGEENHISNVTISKL